MANLGLRLKLFGSLLLAASLAVADTALAGDKAAADVLFNDAKKLMDEGKYKEACVKFEASYENDKTLGTLLNMADCHEKIGKIATAWSEWSQAYERAGRDGDERAGFAKQHRDALLSRLPKLKIDVATTHPNLVVQRDGTAMNAASFGQALPIDPGQHTIVVRRGNQVLQEQQVSLDEAATESVTLDLVAIDKAHPPKDNTQTVVVTPDVPGTGRTIGYVVGGVGVAAVAVAGVLEILAITAKPGSETCNDNGFCLPEGAEDGNRAKTFATAGQWVGLGGLVAVGVGLTLILTAPSAPQSPSKTARFARSSRLLVSPWMSPASGGVMLGGNL